MFRYMNNTFKLGVLYDSNWWVKNDVILLKGSIDIHFINYYYFSILYSKKRLTLFTNFWTQLTGIMLSLSLSLFQVFNLYWVNCILKFRDIDGDQTCNLTVFRPKGFLCELPLTIYILFSRINIRRKNWKIRN